MSDPMKDTALSPPKKTRQPVDRHTVYSPQGGRAILLSIKPKFANLIIDGSKRVEFRRAIPAQPISTIVIYSSSPVKAIVALADVSEIVEASPSRLCEISRDNGGGLTTAALLDYFESKKVGYALMLENVRVFSRPVRPWEVFKKFLAPQSFMYLRPRCLQRFERILELEKHK